jgi:disulfide bond formation protein DsbB
MLNFRIQFCFQLIFLISCIAIISAFYIEYILGHQACNLCIIGRIPYALSITILLLNYKFIINEKLLIIVLILIFIFSFLISIYHFGIEQGIFEESLLCNLKEGVNILSKKELLKELQKIPVSCKDVTFRILGLSLTSINIFISLAVIFLLTKIFINYEKNK